MTEVVKWGGEVVKSYPDEWDDYFSTKILQGYTYTQVGGGQVGTGYASGGVVAPVKWNAAATDWSPKPHQCPLCGKQKHSAPMSRNLREALDKHSLEDYDFRGDDSVILCPFPGEGPARPYATMRTKAYGVTMNPGTYVIWPSWDPGPPWQKLMKGLEDLSLTIKLWQENPPTHSTSGKLGPTKVVEYKAIEKPKIAPEEIAGIELDMELFDEAYELPDMKADWDALVEQANKKFEYFQITKEAK